jgi:hypothetical protein
MLTAALYGCGTWFLTLGKEHRVRVFENRALRRIFGPRGRKWREAGEDCVMRSFITCTHHQILSGCQIQENEMGGIRSTHEMRNVYKIVIGKPESRRALGR